MSIRTVLPLLTLCLAACGGNETTMESHMGSLQQMITSAQTDLSEHKSAVTAATSVMAVMDLESSHATKMSSDVTAMHGSVDQMASCMKNGAPPDTAMMKDALDKMKSEDDAHHTAMSTVADLTAARAEEDRHQQAMTEHVNSMSSEQMSMMDQAAGYSCSMSMSM